MNNEHPITPPPELVAQWLGTYFGTTVTGEVSDVELVLAAQAARWGADQELEACCEWGVRNWTYIRSADELRAARRPKPPSLKEQALDELKHWDDVLGASTKIIRRALEQLDD